MMICISAIDWANIEEAGVSVGGVNMFCLSSLMCGEQHLITVIGQ